MAGPPAIVPAWDDGDWAADLVLSLYVNVLGQTLASLPALCLSLLHRIVSSEIADEHIILTRDDERMQCSWCTSPCFGNTEVWLLSDQASALSCEEESSSCCKAHNHTMLGPDTSVKVRSKEINALLAVAKSKDEDDEDDDEDEEGEDNTEDAAEDDHTNDNGEGEEDVKGNEDDEGGDDDDDDEDGKGDEEDEEDGLEGEDEEDEEDGLEGEDEEDEDGVEDEEEDEDDEGDETPEPPKKKRK